MNNAIGLDSTDQNSQDTCFYESFFENKGLKFRYLLINNSKDCPGKRFVSHPPNYNIYVADDDSQGFEDYLLGFANHLKTIENREILNVNVYVFTEKNEREMQEIVAIISELTKTFYELIGKRKFIPLNIYIIYNANEIFNDMKTIPIFPPSD